MVNRTATSALFGFDFQANAAIVLMLENIKDMVNIRLEGAEDIEINLENGSCVLAQAKSVVNSSTDFSNVITKLKDAIISLSEAYNKSSTTVKELIYITNTPNPFNEPQLNTIFYGTAQRGYDTLPQSLKDRVLEITSNIKQPLDTSKFKIQILPFETDNDKERYKCVMEAVGDFISLLGNIPISKNDLHRIWSYDIFKSGTKRDSNIKLSKNDIIWPIIVLITNNDNYDDDELDESEVAEISRAYKEFISTCTERYEFVTKILSAYNEFRIDLKPKERKYNFIQSESRNYLSLFEDSDITISEEIQEKLMQIIIRNILNQRIQINNIKSAVNL